MGRRKKRARAAGQGPEEPDPSDSIGGNETDSSEDSVDSVNKYATFTLTSYSRRYPENSNKSDFIVFLSHKDDKKPFSDYDRMALSQGIRKHCIAGVLHLRPFNKFKVGITFDLANNANVFLQNKKFLDELFLKASIPATDTEITGVVTSVPVGMSNKQIFSSICSSKNVIQVRRFMRKIQIDGGASTLQPTQTVAITFASTQLPEFVYLDSWRHEVRMYVPPVKQCLKCLRFGHIAKFCKNDEVCSICTQKHSFKQCIVDRSNAKCANCGGNHIAISISCPMKKAKVEENKIKSHSAKYADLFSSSEFPHLAARTFDIQINNLMKSDKFVKLLIEAVMKVVTNNKNNIPINSESVQNILKDTFIKKSPP